LGIALAMVRLYSTYREGGLQGHGGEQIFPNRASNSTRQGVELRTHKKY